MEPVVRTEMNLCSSDSKIEKLSQNQLDHYRCGCHYLSPGARVENLGQKQRRQPGCHGCGRILEPKGHGLWGCVDIIGS